MTLQSGLDLHVLFFKDSFQCGSSSSKIQRLILKDINHRRDALFVRASGNSANSQRQPGNSPNRKQVLTQAT